MNGHRKPSSRAAAMAPAPAAGHNYSAANSQSHKILANRLNGSLDAGRRVPAPAPAPAPAPNHRSKGATANASFGKQLMSLNGKALSKSMDGGGGGRPFYYYARNSHVKPATPADPAAMAKDPAFVLAPLRRNAAKDPKAGYPNPSFSKSCVELKAERKTVARVKNAEKIELRSLIVEKKIAESVAESLRAKVRSVDMPCDMQVHAFRSARGALDRQTGAPFSCREVAFFLKKEFDKAYGPAWHCIVGSNFGSFVTHSVGGFLYFSIDKVSVLLFKTAVETLPEP